MLQELLNIESLVKINGLYLEFVEQSILIMKEEKKGEVSEEKLNATHNAVIETITELDTERSNWLLKLEPDKLLAGFLLPLADPEVLLNKLLKKLEAELEDESKDDEN